MDSRYKTSHRAMVCVFCWVASWLDCCLNSLLFVAQAKGNNQYFPFHRISGAHPRTFSGRVLNYRNKRQPPQRRWAPGEKGAAFSLKWAFVQSVFVCECEWVAKEPGDGWSVVVGNLASRRHTKGRVISHAHLHFNFTCRHLARRDQPALICGFPIIICE